MYTRYYFMPHFQGEEDINNGEARAPPVAFLVRSAVRMSRARWFSFLRRVFRYQNGPRSDLMSNPFNSMSWILFEFIVLMVQMLVITFVMVISRHEKPVWPLRIWIAGYNLGNLLSMPLLYWRYRCSSVVSRASGGAASDVEQQRRNNNGDESRSSSHVTVMMNKSRTFLELFFAIWFVMGNVWIFDTRYRSFAEAPRLHGLCISLLAWNAIGYSFPFLLFLLLCCFVPLLSRVVGFNMNSASEGRGASDDQISQLPQWKYKDIIDVDVEPTNIHHHHQNTWKEGEKITKMKLVIYNVYPPCFKRNARPRIRVLNPLMMFWDGCVDDPKECCICLAKYSDKEEVRQLPCLHLFHQRCVDQWLRIISSCPLCKQELEK